MIIKYNYSGDEHCPSGEFEYEVYETDGQKAMVEIFFSEIKSKSKTQLSDRENKIMKETIEFILEDLSIRDIEGSKEMLELYYDELKDYFKALASYEQRDYYERQKYED